MRKPLGQSIIFLTALFIALAVFSFISSAGNWYLLYAKLIWSLLVSYLGLRIYQEGIISKYRSILFILIAFFFLIEFKFLWFFKFPHTPTPYCHIAQAPTLFNFIHSQFLAISSGDWLLWGALTLGFLWLIIMFTIGQGICSWVCFYGGLDEAFSKLREKPLFNLKISSKWRDFPLAFLIFLLIISFLQGLPIFCKWFCPFKMTGAFWDTYSIGRIAQITLFGIALAGFVILLPILTKKRTFCSLICPFGALVSVCGRVSPYRVTINQEKCIHCGKCQDICPVLAIEKRQLNEYKISSYCNRCAKCVDICPVKAIDITAGKGLTTLSLPGRPGWQIEIRDIFVFFCLLITGVISGSFIPRLFLELLGLK